MQFSLPLEVQAAVKQAHVKMLQQPQYQMSPLWRQQIYKALGQCDPLRITPIRGWLALITAEHVHTNGSAHKLRGFSSEGLLRLGRDALQGMVSVNVVLHAAEQAWTQLEQLGSLLDAPPYRSAEFDAGTAVVRALFETIGICSFDELSLTETYIDDWVDPYSSDTAKWAAYSYSGRDQTSIHANTKRKEFWEWWLFTAIPTALYLAQQTQSSG